MSKEKNYRFYFSQKQNNIDEEMWSMPTRFVFVKTPDGYKQYSELCSIKGTRCNWSDAELVYEADEMPEIIVHEAIPELIAKLQSKLAESEKNYKDARELSVDQFYSLTEMLKYLQKENDQLKKQLAEKDKKIRSYEHELENYEHELEVYKNNDNIYANCIRSFANKNKRERNQTAIAELEKVKEWLELKYFDKEQINYLSNAIDQQIKELKREE